MKNRRGEKEQGRKGGFGRTPPFSFSPFLLFVLLLSRLCAQAHGPFDSSAQLIILSDALELNATLGMDGAKQVLLNAGLSEAEATLALANRGPSTLYNLSADLAPHFFVVKAGGHELKAKRMQVITDGLEARFVATYAGSSAGEVEVQARYFDGIEAMKPGAFIAMDENRNVKGSAMFSHSKTDATVKLTPASASNPLVEIEPVNAEARAAGVGQVAPAGQPESGHAQSCRFALLWLAGALLAGVTVILILLRKIRRAR